MDLEEFQGWCVYLLLCTNGALYAGITNDLAARYKMHAIGKGAKFTRANPPVGVMAVRMCDSQGEALRLEWSVKQLPSSRKIKFLLEGT